MSRRKTQYIILAVLLITLIFLNIKSHLPYPTLDKNLAMLYIKAGDKFSAGESYELANFYYKAAMKTSNKTYWLDYNIGKNIVSECWNMPRGRAKEKKLNEAVERLQNELIKHPNHSHILAQLGHAYYLLEDYDNAIKYYKLTIEKDPKWVYGINKLAFIYSHVKDENEIALGYIEKVLSIEPNDNEYYFLYGWILSALKRYDDAIKAYNKYLEKNPDSVAALVNISGCEISNHDYDSAEKHVEHGLKYNSHSAYLLSNKADILLYKHKFDEAAAIANEINKRYYSGYIGYITLAKIERYKGNKVKADEYYQMAKENAKEYCIKYCDKPYDLSDNNGNCSNRYDFLEHFDENRAKPLDF